MRQEEPQEGLDFYYENGLLVFTAEYLLNRGFCCRSGCRHCPYGYQEEDSSPAELGPGSSPG